MLPFLFAEHRADFRQPHGKLVAKRLIASTLESYCRIDCRRNLFLSTQVCPNRHGIGPVPTPSGWWWTNGCTGPDWEMPRSVSVTYPPPPESIVARTLRLLGRPTCQGETPLQCWWGSFLGWGQAVEETLQTHVLCGKFPRKGRNLIFPMLCLGSLLFIRCGIELPFSRIAEPLLFPIRSTDPTCCGPPALVPYMYLSAPPPSPPTTLTETEPQSLHVVCLLEQHQPL